MENTNGISTRFVNVTARARSKAYDSCSGSNARAGKGHAHCYAAIANACNGQGVTGNRTYKRSAYGTARAKGILNGVLDGLKN